MSLSRYAEYKDSGVEWLGELPNHWSLRKMRWLCEIKKRIAGELGHEVLSITQQGIRVRDLESNDGQLSMDYSKYQFVEVGDFAMNHMDLLTGYVDVSTISGVTSPDYRVFSIREPSICHDKYLLYLLQMGYKNKIFYAYGQGSSQLGRWRLPTEQFNELPFPLPPMIEQRRIADFLDSETAKIDALIAEQVQLIALLKEKRQAVISHAVTKGLNPDAPMKDSGIEWLGEIPTHWAVTRLKHATYFIVDCPHETPTYSDDGEYLVVRTADIEDGRIDESEMYRVTEYEYLNRIRRQSLRMSDIVYGREGERWGHAALVPADNKFCLGQRMMQFRANKEFCAEFLMWQLNAETTYRQGQVDTVGATSPHVNVATIRNYALTEPPYDEQVMIGEFLRQQAEQFDCLMNEAAKAIDLLRERRSALISAAVTGKINICNQLHSREAA